MKDRKRNLLPYETIAEAEDPNWMMILPLTVFVIVMLFIGLHSQTLTGILEAVVSVMK